MNNSNGNTNKTQNNSITRDELEKFIEEAKRSCDWSKVEKANVSKITDMSNLFFRTKGIKDLDLSSWDTSNVVDMDSMFYKSDFNSPLNFDTSKVKIMRCMFSHSDFNHPLNFDTSNVTTMSNMFAYSKYNSPLNFDTSKVKIMRCMFSHSDFNHPLNFDTSNVINMEFMFSHSKYNHHLNFDTSNVEDMEFIFKNSSFNKDISDWVIQDNDKNQDVIEYRHNCIIKRKEREAIEASIGNNNNNASIRGFKL